MRKLLCTPSFVIELVIMVQSFILGVYLASPFFFISAGDSKFTPVLDTMSDSLALYVVASVFVIGSILGAYGRITKQNRVNSTGLFMIMLSHLYVLSISIMAGVLFINWLAEACILLMIMVLWGGKRVIVHGES